MTSDLTPIAASAMKAELAKRRGELESQSFEVYVGPTAKPLPRFLGLWLWGALVALSALGGFVVWAWERLEGLASQISG